MTQLAPILTALLDGRPAEAEASARSLTPIELREALELLLAAADVVEDEIASLSD